MSRMYKQNWKRKDSIEKLFAVFRSSTDFIQYDVNTSHIKYWISYFETLVDVNILNENILKPIHSKYWQSLEELKNILPVKDIFLTIDTDLMKEKLLEGFVMISLSEYGSPCLLVNAKLNKAREVTLPEVEFTVIGPKEAFVESIESNINLIRKRLPIEELRIRTLKIGRLTQTRLAIIYIEGIADEENVFTVWQRISNIQIDQVMIVRTLRK